ncbi:helix-turn-helix domain-containing protein [Novosphingobium sp. YJ-S2-02]|uniref:Helix-turn-helix domain-containing protein n=1 Tax=Novosphingobium aureum TaxID=2792964 RepID=A0A931HDZ5_9SPHN|nr:helix-turn-helix domain-containing protein [Novosphingobium aureum]MBH0113668.1 helix-turn-helix domain-containing protein [Novosphingobium aureum]
MSFHDKLLSRKGRARVGSSVDILNPEDLSDIQNRGIPNASAIDTLVPLARPATGRVNGTGVKPAFAHKEIETMLAEAPPFSVRSLATRWDCSQGAVRNLIRAGKISHFRIGDLIRIPAEEVGRFECRQ